MNPEPRYLESLFMGICLGATVSAWWYILVSIIGHITQ